ncbi:hypothetical protein B0H14DRAFT_2816574, partial [Mycena olivaceomarginata]
MFFSLTSLLSAVALLAVGANARCCRRSSRPPGVYRDQSVQHTHRRRAFHCQGHHHRGVDRKPQHYIRTAHWPWLL